MHPSRDRPSVVTDDQLRFAFRHGVFDDPRQFADAPIADQRIVVGPVDALAGITVTIGTRFGEQCLSAMRRFRRCVRVNPERTEVSARENDSGKGQGEGAGRRTSRHRRGEGGVRLRGGGGMRSVKIGGTDQTPEFGSSRWGEQSLVRITFRHGD